MPTFTTFTPKRQRGVNGSRCGMLLGVDWWKVMLLVCEMLFVAIYLFQCVFR